MNLFTSGGVVVGVMVGLILAGIFLRVANKDNKMRTAYDERQKEIRGNGYRYGFYTLMIYDALLIALEMGEISLPVELYQLIFVGIVLAGMVLAGYTIWKGAYWGQNNNRRRYALIFLAIGLLNAIPVIGAVKGGELIRDGKFQSPLLNLICLVMLVVLGVLLLLREFLDQKETGEE